MQTVWQQSAYNAANFPCKQWKLCWPVYIGTWHWWHLWPLFSWANILLWDCSTPATSLTMWTIMAILVVLASILSGSTDAFNTEVKTCCPPGQFLAIDDWQGSRQSVEGVWYSKDQPGVVLFFWRLITCDIRYDPSSFRCTPYLVYPQVPRLAANDASRQSGG